MFEKEILTKKQLIKCIYPTIPFTILAVLALSFMAVFFYFSAELFFMVELTITNLFGYIMLGVALFMLCEAIKYLLSPLVTFINLHRGKYYITVAPLMNKEAGDDLEFTSAGFKSYNKYFFSFADYGTACPCNCPLRCRGPLATIFKRIAVLPFCRAEVR